MIDKERDEVKKRNSDKEDGTLDGGSEKGIPKLIEGGNPQKPLLNEKIRKNEEILKKERAETTRAILENGEFKGGRVKVDHAIWAIVDPLLGRTSDTKLSLFFGIPEASIENRRYFLRILPYEYIDYELIDPLLDKGTDEEISELFDGFIPVNKISERRAELKKL